MVLPMSRKTQQRKQQLSFADRLLGPPVAGRECGSCTACCVLPRINEPTLQKAEGEICPNLAGAGCGVYETRPQTCRTYFCVWRRIGALPDDARPDKLGALLHLHRRDENETNPLLKVYIKVQALKSWEEVSKPTLEAVMAVLRRARLAVWRQDGGEMHLAHPDDLTARAIHGEPLTPQAALEAEAWIKAHS
jgi:hypothetical protein